MPEVSVKFPAVIREFSFKFPAEKNTPLKNFLGTSSRVPLFFAAMILGRVLWFELKFK